MILPILAEVHVYSENLQHNIDKKVKKKQIASVGNTRVRASQSSSACTKKYQAWEVIFLLISYERQKVNSNENE